ncbi:MAG: flippase activity-associated protein Agl23, partial [Dehalococcoidia bacterium]
MTDVPAPATSPARRWRIEAFARLDRIDRIDRVAWIVIAIVVVALATRLIGLGARAVHHDEALHFMYSWYFTEGRGHHHDPLMHGPLQFHLMAGFFKLFGDGEFIGRLPHALAGTALVATPLLLRRYLNGPAVVLAALFFAISPALLYYSRFARNEPLIALFTVLGVVAVFRYRDTGRLRWLVLFSAMLALHFAAKETAYLLAAMFLLYFNGATAHELFWAPRRARGESASLGQQLRHGAWLLPSAWVIAVLWPFLGRLRSCFGWTERPREADLLVLTATLVLPLLAAAVEVPFVLGGGELTLSEERRLAWIAIPSLLVVAGAVGIAWGRLDWAICFVVFMGILVPLYSTWGTYYEGVAGIFWTSLDYWIDQQEVQRANQPWFFYVMLTPLYEGLVLLPAIVGGAWLALRRRDRLATFLLWWFVAIFAALTFAGEKMPWLVVHITLPLCLLAAYSLGRAAPRVREALQTGQGHAAAWAGGGVASVVVASLLALTVWTDVGLNIDHPSTPIEPFMYAQTTDELRDL